MQLVNSHTCSEEYLAIALCGTDKNAFVSTEAGSIEVYDSQGEHVRTLTGHKGGVWALAATDNRLLSGGTDKLVLVWDAESGECLQRLAGHTGTVRCLRILNSKTAVSSSRDGTIRVWDLEEGQCLKVMEGHEATVRDMDIGEDFIVSASYDQTARIWDTQIGECLHVLRGHTGQVFRVIIHDSKIFTGSVDTTIRVWDVKSGVSLAILQGNTSLVGQLAIMEGKLVSAAADGCLKFWDIEHYQETFSVQDHQNSVVSLATHGSKLITGSNGDKVSIRNGKDGSLVGTIGETEDAVWKIGHVGKLLVIALRRGGSSMAEFWNVESGET